MRDAHPDHRTMPPEVTSLLSRNIRAMVDARRAFERSKTWTDCAADWITRRIGSMGFVGVHAVLVAAWIVLNVRVIPGVRPWDPSPFAMLAMIVSAEAIFLSTFVLITQNRMQRLADTRADLDLQVNLLAEHEVTRALKVIDAIAKRVGAEVPDEKQVEALEEDVEPEQLLREIERVDRENDPLAR